MSYYHPSHVRIAGQPIHFNGWKRDLPDNRDVPLHQLKMALPKSIPASGMTNEFIIRVRNQGPVGSCTGHGTTYVGNQLAYKQGHPEELSPLYLYYFTRVGYEHISATEDSGASVRNAVKCLAQYGSCLEADWPYELPEQKFSIRPDRGAIKNAHKHMALKYARVADLTALKQAIVLGFPIVGGFTCFESLESDKVTVSGFVPMPGPNESVIGGHCVAFVGYDDVKKVVRFRNSWGEGWGDHGDGYLDYGYFNEKLADDLWMITAEMLP